MYDKFDPTMLPDDPTPEEIAVECLLIQSEWTEEVRMSRRYGDSERGRRNDYWELD